MTPRHVHTLTAEDVGQSSHRIAGRPWSVASWIGSVRPIDIGKRVYLVDDVLTVESDAQRAARRARTETPKRESGARIFARKGRGVTHGE